MCPGQNQTEEVLLGVLCLVSMDPLRLAGRVARTGSIGTPSAPAQFIQPSPSFDGSGLIGVHGRAERVTTSVRPPFSAFVTSSNLFRSFAEFSCGSMNSFPFKGQCSLCGNYFEMPMSVDCSIIDKKPPDVTLSCGVS